MTDIENITIAIKRQIKKYRNDKNENRLIAISSLFKQRRLVQSGNYFKTRVTAQCIAAYAGMMPMVHSGFNIMTLSSSPKYFFKKMKEYRGYHKNNQDFLNLWNYNEIWGVFVKQYHREYEEGDDSINLGFITEQLKELYKKLKEMGCLDVG